MDKKQEKKQNGWHGRMSKRLDTVARLTALFVCITTAVRTWWLGFCSWLKKKEEPTQPKDYDMKHGRK